MTRPLPKVIAASQAAGCRTTTPESSDRYAEMNVAIRG